MIARAPYVAAMCRPLTESVFAPNGEVMQDVLDANIDEFCRCIERASKQHDARLIVFPEFALTGYSVVEYRHWVAAGVSFPGPTIDRIAKAARDAGVYVLVQAAETHDAFPDRYFLSAGILTPEGEVGLVHRKNYTLSLRTSPINMYTKFCEALGEQAALPVLDTPLGVLGVAIAAEVHWPEAVRSLALSGAEVILNPIANVEGVDYLKRPGADWVRSVRAFENVAYLAMTNIVGGEVEPAVYDFTGREIGHVVDDGLFTLAEIDIEKLRGARAQGGMNFLAQIQQPLHQETSSLNLWPEDTHPAGPVADFSELVTVEQAVWRRLCADGRGKLPASS